jgi:two-component system nitrate/nitrite sensor histidine kinase NarX
VNGLPSQGGRNTRVASRVGLLVAGLLVIALGSIGLTLWIGWQLEGGAAAVNETGRLRMQTWRVAHAVARGDAAQTQLQLREVDAALRLIRDGDPARPLFLPRDRLSTQSYRAVEAGWQDFRAKASRAPARFSDQEVDAMVGRIDRLVAAIESQLASWSTLLSSVQLALMGLAIVAAVAFLYASNLLVFAPVDRLRRGLAAVERGDLGVRVVQHSQDEFGDLADGFNRMAARTQALYTDLEGEVSAKTRALSEEKHRLAALYEASAFAARAATPQDLAAGFTDRLRRVARCDAVAIRWLDTSQQRMVLLAAQGLPPALLEAERCLKPGDCHCGTPQSQTRVIRIHSDAEQHTKGCAKAGFVSVVSVALPVQSRSMGEITLFYRDAPTLDRDDRDLLDSLASHLSGALEALRLEALQREAAVAEERALLARELHDSIAQSLAFMKIQLQLLKDAQQRGKATETLRLLDELELGLKESSADVRALLMNFRTRTDGDDLLPALQQTLQKFRLQSGLQAELQVDGHGAPLPADVQVQLLHVVQEALSNVRKHAQAQTVQVRLAHQPHWQIEIRDDGRGFDPVRDAPDDSHVGLRIMRERAAKVGAAVELDSQPGAGTRVRVSLPESAALSHE